MLPRWSPARDWGERVRTHERRPSREPCPQQRSGGVAPNNTQKPYGMYMDRFLSWYVTRERHQMTAFTRGDGHEIRRLLLVCAIRFALSIALNFYIQRQIPNDSMGTALASVFWGLITVYFVAAPIWRAQLFRQGWFWGRSDMRKAYIEARRRGITEDQWMYDEFERDSRAL